MINFGTSFPPCPSLPPSLSPPSPSSQSVIEHSHLSSDMFVLYLHQNYLHMHSRVDDVVSAIQSWSEEASKLPS